MNKLHCKQNFNQNFYDNFGIILKKLYSNYRKIRTLPEITINFAKNSTLIIIITKFLENFPKHYASRDFKFFFCFSTFFQIFLNFPQNFLKTLCNISILLKIPVDSMKNLLKLHAIFTQNLPKIS